MINASFSRPHSSTSYSRPGSMKIDEKDFLSFITVKRGLAPQSIRHCMIRIRIINKWLETNELNKQSVEAFFLELRTRGLKNNSLNTYYFVFNQLVEYCKDRGLPADFLSGFKSFKKTKAEIIIFTHEEIEKIINTSLSYGSQYGKDLSFLDFRYRTFTSFIAYTGCRFSEVANLKIKNIDWDGKARIVGTKTNENRIVYFTEPLLSDLKELVQGKGEDELVFLNSAEHKINAQDFSPDLKRRALTAGVTKRVFPHNFRHSYATHLLEAGVPVTEVAMLLGHKDIQTTFGNYMHLADKTLQRAAMRHPIVRRNVDPKEIVRTIKETFENLHLENDPRFKYSINEEENGLQVAVSFVRV